MSIENYLAEIQDRKRREVESLDIRLAEEKTAIQIKKDNAIKEIQEYYSNDAKLKSEREAARIVEAARLQGKKILFDAINLNLDSAFVIIKEKLRNYAESTDYKVALQKMIATAKKQLGSNINIICREQDRTALTDMGVNVIKTNQTIGGVIAENENGSKELDLTFEELLRIHEDEVKSSILEEMV
ncbi:MAG TPA: V-type ATP synthase subunit E [Candidatus Bathyarchaeia archaeon]|nr:V-type ATP synthase subunit E [Candidatus Bathyarchaeia archaeon]